MPPACWQTTYFYPRPPRGGRRSVSGPAKQAKNFYPRPPRGGRPHCLRPPFTCGKFLSTPSARRATSGDNTQSLPICDFYPRPPRGGRRSFLLLITPAARFLSTPSARRATLAVIFLEQLGQISIHALREEGDDDFADADETPEIFLSTPSARRATVYSQPVECGNEISIHALREEGDAGRSVHISQR